MTTIKLSDYLLERSISDFDTSEIALEQAVAEVNVNSAICEAYMKLMYVTEADGETSDTGFWQKVKNFFISIGNWFRRIVIQLSGWISEKRVDKVIKRLESMTEDEKKNFQGVLPYTNIDSIYDRLVSDLTMMEETLTEGFYYSPEDAKEELKDIRAESKHRGDFKIDEDVMETFGKYNHADYLYAIKKFKKAITDKKNDLKKIRDKIKNKNAADTIDVLKNVSDKDAKQIYRELKKTYNVVYAGVTSQMTKLIDVIKKSEKYLKKNPNALDDIHQGVRTKDEDKFHKQQLDVIDQRLTEMMGDPKLAEMLGYNERNNGPDQGTEAPKEKPSGSKVENNAEEQSKPSKEPSTISELIEFGIERSGETISVERVESIWKDYIDTLNHFGKQVQKITVKNEKYNDIAKKFGKLCESVKFNKNEEYRKFIDDLKNIKRESDGYNVTFGTEEDDIHNPVTDASLFISDFIEFIGAFRAGARLSIYEKRPEKYRKEFDDNFKLVEQRRLKNKQQTSENSPSEGKKHEDGDIPEDRKKKILEICDKAAKLLMSSRTLDKKYWVIYPDKYNAFKKAVTDFVNEYHQVRDTFHYTNRMHNLAQAVFSFRNDKNMEFVMRNRPMSPECQITHIADTLIEPFALYTEEEPSNSVYYYTPGDLKRINIRVDQCSDAEFEAWEREMNNNMSAYDRSLEDADIYLKEHNEAQAEKTDGKSEIKSTKSDDSNKNKDGESGEWKERLKKIQEYVKNKEKTYDAWIKTFIAFLYDTFGNSKSVTDFENSYNAIKTDSGQYARTNFEKCMKILDNNLHLENMFHEIKKRNPKLGDYLRSVDLPEAILIIIASRVVIKMGNPTIFMTGSVFDTDISVDDVKQCESVVSRFTSEYKTNAGKHTKEREENPTQTTGKKPEKKTGQPEKNGDEQQIPGDRLRRLEEVLGETFKLTKPLGDRKYWKNFPELYDEYKEIYDRTIKCYQDMRGKLNTNEETRYNDGYNALGELAGKLPSGDKTVKHSVRALQEIIDALQVSIINSHIYKRIPRQIYIVGEGKTYLVATCEDLEFNLCIKNLEEKNSWITKYYGRAEKFLKEQNDSADGSKKAE